MKTRITLSIFVLLFIAGISGLKAQQSILTAGSNATGSSGSVSFSVGQALFGTTTGTGGIVTQGVQQPYEVLFMDGIGPDKGISLECRVYPNPATNFITLKIENPETSGLTCQISDLKGLLLRDMKITAKETIVAMDELVPGTYFLSVVRNGKPFQTYKIIKN